MRFGALFAALGAALGLSMTAPAAAATLVGDTRVEVTFDLGGAGIAAALLGDASVALASPLTVNFPITGGSLGGGQILHDNSGLRLTRNGATLDLANFIIDLVNQVILADVTPNGGGTISDVAILAFDLSTVSAPDPFDLSDPDLALRFTAVASQTINAVLGLGLANPNALEGVVFGLAATSPTEVPLPAALWLFLAGAGALAARRRAQATA
jgi:hypothetical protein